MHVFAVFGWQKAGLNRLTKTFHLKIPLCAFPYGVSMQNGFYALIPLCAFLLISGCVGVPQDSFQPPNPQNASNATLQLSYSPIQCGQNPWEIWESNSGRQYVRAPTEEEVLKNYYSSVHGIEILNYSSVQVHEVVCAACTCSRPDVLGIKIYEKDKEKMLSLGWKAASQDCPQLMPPSPTFCENGSIVSGGTDENGCQLAPRCVQNNDLPPAPPN